METLLVPAVIGGVLNRFSGYENISWLPGRNVYYAIIALIGISFYLLGWEWAVAIGLGAILYRVPGWYKSIDMGKNEGNIALDMGVMFLRGLCFAPPFLYATYLGHPQAMLMLVAASLAATMAYVIGNYVVKGKDPFWFIEFTAGACFGAAVSWAVLVS